MKIQYGERKSDLTPAMGQKNKLGAVREATGMILISVFTVEDAKRKGKISWCKRRRL